MCIPVSCTFALEAKRHNKYTYIDIYTRATEYMMYYSQGLHVSREKGEEKGEGERRKRGREKGFKPGFLPYTPTHSRTSLTHNYTYVYIG